jgi:hypothetical protein
VVAEVINNNGGSPHIIPVRSLRRFCPSFPNTVPKGAITSVIS